MNRQDTEKHCHCGAAYNGSDHCPECYCEQYESGDCGHEAWCEAGCCPKADCAMCKATS